MKQKLIQIPETEVLILHQQKVFFWETYKYWIGDGLGWKCMVCGKEFNEIQAKKSEQEFCSISCFLDWKEEMKKRMENYIRKTNFMFED